MDLDTILITGLICAFIFPAMAYVSSTLPAPTGVSVNVTEMMNTTGIYIQNHLIGTYNNLNGTLLGRNGSFYANPTVFQAFAFIISNLGTIMTDIVQLPYLDYLSLQLMTVGLSTVIQGAPLGFVITGMDMLYLYMGISMFLLGVSLVQKYNVRIG